MADFLVALADFDRRRGWEPLGHASLFAFLVADLRLSRSAAFYRRSAAELRQRFPEVIEPLRDGKLCLSTVGELAKVLTKENRAIDTPRFFGLSSREAQELVAELQPRPVPSTRMVVTGALSRPTPSAGSSSLPLLSLAAAPPADAHPSVVPLSRIPTSGLANGGGPDGGGDRLVTRRDEIEPLTADIRRVHFNVGKRVVQKLEAAREGLSHSTRGATMEQVLEAALDLLLKKQARARGQVKKPRSVAATTAPSVTAPPCPASSKDRQNQARCQGQRQGEGEGQGRGRGRGSAKAPVADSPRTPIAPSLDAAAPSHRRAGPRDAIPAAVKRAVWERDEGRCSWPLDGGGVCGSTHRLELDHIVPWARWGGETVANLRVVCDAHNALAARREFGARCEERCRSGRRA